MARPKGWQPYTLKDGTQVPSVTTITGRFKDPGGLYWWNWDQGRQGKDYNETRDDAATAGTIAHQMVEALITGKKYTAPADADVTIIRKAERARDNFSKWAKQTRLQPVHTELRLVSETLRVGGTLDVTLIDDQLAIGDWKTGSGIYADMVIQVAAYGLLWEENFPDQPITGGYHILRFSKDEADITHKYFGDLQDAQEAFILQRKAYDLDQKLKARVR